MQITMVHTLSPAFTSILSASFLILRRSPECALAWNQSVLNADYHGVHLLSSEVSTLSLRRFLFPVVRLSAPSPGTSQF